jgi:hypothetical protein
VFERGVERTAMFVKPSDKINLTIDTELFDETIKYEGSEESSFLAKLYLLEEENDFFGKVFYLSNMQEYKGILEDYKTAVILKFGRITDSTFIKNEIAELDKSIANFISRQGKLSEYTKDVKNYMWETKNLGRNFNFYAAMDSLNSEQFSRIPL